MSVEEFGQMYEEALDKIQTCGLDFRDLALKVPLKYKSVVVEYLSANPQKDVRIEYV